MDIYTLDFETYYDRAYSLSKITTEEYVRDPRFEAIGLGIKKNNGPTYFYPKHMIGPVLQEIDFSEAGILCHNTMFDGAILSWRYGVRPKVWFDTLCMARAVHGIERSASLKSLAEQYGIGEKGTEVLNALGKRYEDFSDAEIAAYGSYCANDVDLTYKLFCLMGLAFPKDELKLIDLTLRMFINPTLRLDTERLEKHLEDTVAEKAALLEKAGITDKADLMSNQKFAELLKTFGVAPPTKISLTTGKETLAMAKSDEGFKALAEHEDPRVQTLVAARLGNKSTLEETRTQRFIDISKRGALPVPVRYYAAHTGRWGGDDKINLQNLPSRGANGKKLKRGIIAPEGYTLVESDSSQIEARTLAWLAGQDDVVETFAAKGDVYKKMASKIYGVPETEVTKDQRHVGKTTVLGCFAGDTLVLTDRGYIPIIQVTVTDKVWDGNEWVTHQGVVAQGVKPTIRMAAVAATADHEILTEHGWQEWSEVTTNPSLFQSAIRLATLKSYAGSQNIKQDGTPLSGVLAAGKAWWTAQTSKRAVQRVAIRAQNVRLTENAGLSTAASFLMTPTANDSLTGFLRACRAATPKLTLLTTTTGGEALLYTPHGVQIAQSSYGICSRWMDGMTRRAISTASTIIRGMSRAICGLPPNGKITPTVGLSPHCKQNLMTYDIAFAGPKNRYTVATTAGPIIVHNCGYGMGGDKFQSALKNGFPSVDLPLHETKRIISVYREANWAIADLWKRAGIMLQYLARGDVVTFGRNDLLVPDPDVPGVRLPNGLLIRYDGLRAQQGEKGVEYVYDTRKGPTRIYGGKVVENVTQALARIIIGEQMLHINKRYRVVLTVHDSIVCCVRDEEVDECRAFIESVMRWTPTWAKGLPVDCESGVGKNYGDCDG